MGGHWFQLEMPGFEGPLELLLQLIERNELDVTSVSLALVADQFLEHVRSAREVDPDNLADFLVIGARLLWLKSLALLPHASARQRLEAEEATADIKQLLLEYKLYRQAATSLADRESESLRCYPREVTRPSLPSTPLEPMATAELLRAIQRALIPTEDAAADTLPAQTLRVADKMESIIGWLDTHRSLTFDLLISAAASRHEIVVTFLALLELVRLGLLDVIQNSPYGEIRIEPAPVQKLPS